MHHGWLGVACVRLWVTRAITRRGTCLRLVSSRLANSVVWHRPTLLRGLAWQWMSCECRAAVHYYVVGACVLHLTQPTMCMWYDRTFLRENQEEPIRLMMVFAFLGGLCSLLLPAGAWMCLHEHASLSSSAATVWGCIVAGFGMPYVRSVPLSRTAHTTCPLQHRATCTECAGVCVVLAWSSCSCNIHSLLTPG
jgi:hypothetical protein